MKKLISFLLLASVFCLWTPLEATQIYEWIDQNGVRHFTNEPPPPGAKIVNEQTAIQSSEADNQSNTQVDQEAQDEDQDVNQQEPQADEQPESQQAAPQEQAGYSDSDSDNDNDGEGVIVDPYVRRPEQIRREERRREEDEEVVTPLPRRDRVRERIR